MPIEQVSGGFRWGQHGAVFPTREGAERQEAAARAHGYTGDELPAAGVLVRGPDGHVLLLKRADGKGWALPGGGLEHDEGPEAAARREMLEETGHSLKEPFKELCRANDRKVDYTTFGCDVDELFEPKLNDEHTEHVWAAPGELPDPLHPGVAALFDGLARGKTRWPRVGEVMLAGDKAMTVKPRPGSDALAMDKGSVRTITVDGRMRVEVANISKANVCPYYGEEIPDFEKLGLEPRRKYMLLRDPDELAKAASTFNGLPLLDAHVPSTAWDHPSGLVVGATGTDAVFEAPYLKNSLVIWTQEAIDGIESDEQRELSSAYRYRADMTPGTYDGQQYDGVMRDILGNHVALVAAGRAGPDVVVGDSQPVKEEKGMTKVKALSRKAALARGALMAFPKTKALAADAKFNEIVQAITVANWKESRPKLEAAIKPKLATDADMQDVVALLDVLEKEEEGVGDADPVPDPAAKPGLDADPVEEVLAMLKGKVSDDELAAIAQKLAALKGTGAADDKDPKEEKDMVSKPAMDAAIAEERKAADARIAQAVAEAEKNTMTRLNGIREAERVAEPWVGKLSGAFDSAEGVYRAALDVLGKPHKDLHPSALRPVLEAQPKPGTTAPQRMAADADVKGFQERFPQAAAIRTV